MNYRIYLEPDYTLESMSLLNNLFSETSATQEKENILEKYTGSITPDDLNPFFAEAEALEAYFNEKIHFDMPDCPLTGRETAAFLYKKREPVDNFPGGIFYFYDQFLSHGTDSKLLAVIAYAMEEYFVDHDLDSRPLDVHGEAELFRLLETSGLDDATKYETLKLYINFDAYYAYHQRLITEVTRLIKDKLPLFTKKIAHCMQQTDAALQKDGVRFFKDLCGVDISEEPAYRIHPILQAVNTLGFSGSNLTTHQINIGIHFQDLSERFKNAKSFKDSLQEFLKVLSDNTKLNILQMLKDESCYGGQIAEKLGLTGATISYHMAALNKLELIFIRKEAAKVYYSLNKEKIRHYLDGLETWLLIS